jgi:hypothetical protein
MEKFNNDLTGLTKCNIIYHSVAMDVERTTDRKYIMNSKYPDRITKKVVRLPKFANIKHITNHNEKLNGSVIFLGEQYNIIGIDIDNKDDTLIKYDEICKKNGHDRKTLRTITPNNGYHEYYTLTNIQRDALKTFKSKSGDHFGLNIDVKYNNQYFYGPSIFGDKNEFTYKIDMTVPPVILPDFIFDEIVKYHQICGNKKKGVVNKRVGSGNVDYFSSYM